PANSCRCRGSGRPRGRTKRGTMNLKLYVGNLAFSTQESALEALFAEAGPVQSINLIRDRATGQSRGFAFVEMETEEGARVAIERFHEHDLDGRRLTVN